MAIMLPYSFNTQLSEISRTTAEQATLKIFEKVLFNYSQFYYIHTL